jgi:hypothetical protein
VSHTLKPFTDSDWDAFAGATRGPNNEPPLVAYEDEDDGLAVVISYDGAWFLEATNGDGDRVALRNLDGLWAAQAEADKVFADFAAGRL